MKARLVSLRCFVLTLLPQKSLGSSSIWSSFFCFTLPINCCVPECHQKEVKSSTAEKAFFFVSAVASEGKQTKERSSPLPKELLKFVGSGWKILENA